MKQRFLSERVELPSEGRLNAKGAEETIAYSPDINAKVQLLLQDKEHIREQEKRKMEELE